MAEQHFVVIGNGPAGNEAALTLRHHAPEARVTIISREWGGCYRPHLLPQFVAGKLTEENLYVFSAASYKDNRIKLRSGQEVVTVHPDKREIILDHKEILPFDGLIIAVGGRPRIPENLMVFGDLMLTLKTVQDAKIWIRKLNETDTVLMIGGDLTSLSFTTQLMDMGKKIYFALNEEAFWPLRFDRHLYEQIAGRLSLKGVEVLKYSRIKGMNRLTNGMVEVNTDHEKVRAGVVGAFFGLTPDIAFLARSGLKIDRGILVDEYLHTGFEGIYATGDCAQIFHPDSRDYWVSIGHDNAVALGRTAALNLIGERVKAEAAMACIFDVQGVRVNSSWWMEF
ncbi:MAG: NAD(P)/FAD-dependent oxidoreductase [Deltaproteobacteria bacterium]|nr:NAD(P)/FAD-dependent oxidoreductase [Deltaproteobacteria bacterium]